MKQPTSEQREYLQRITDKVLRAVRTEIDQCPGLLGVFAELRSLGIFCQVKYNIDLNVIVREGFIPPSDLSAMSETKLDEMFTGDDLEFLRKMQKGCK